MDNKYMKGCSTLFNIINCKGNANKNHSETLFHTYQNGQNQDTIPNVGEDMEQLEVPYTVGQSVKWHQPLRELSESLL